MRLRPLLTHLIALALGALLVVLLVPDSRIIRVEPGGVRVHEPGVDDSLVLVAHYGAFDADQTTGHAELIDRDGAVVHEWETPFPVAGHAEMAADRSLTYIGITGEGFDAAPAPGAGGVLMTVDSDGDELWRHEDPLLHHDWTRLPDGTVAYLRWASLGEEASSSVEGGIPGTEADGLVWDDEIVELDENGSERVVWRARDGLDPNRDAISPFLGRAEWTHANSIRFVPSDPLTSQEAYLLSFRQNSLVMMVSRRGEVIWRYGGDGVLHQQHDPSLLDNGNVLIFDNGQYRLDTVSASKVLEVDPRTGEIVWQYGGPGVGGFEMYSSIMSGAQRLDNGNTLITEALPGILTEVTPEGTVVWQYRNDYVTPSAFGGPNRAVFKARAYADG